MPTKSGKLNQIKKIYSLKKFKKKFIIINSTKFTPVKNIQLS